MTTRPAVPSRSRTVRAGRRWMGAVVLPIVAVVGAWTIGTDSTLTIAPESRLWIEGTSTVRSFRCDATALEGAIALRGDAAGPLAEVGRAVQSVELEVSVASLDCRNGTMNDHMRKALQASRHPVIRFQLASHEIAPQPGGGLIVTMTGTLTMAGTDREITMTADAAEESPGRYRITGKKALDMTEWGIEPPRLMLGTMRVHDDVTIQFDILLVPSGAMAKAG